LARSERVPAAVLVKLTVEIADEDDVARMHPASRVRALCLKLPPDVIRVDGVKGG